jgi:hypothetical protein
MTISYSWNLMTLEKEDITNSEEVLLENAICKIEFNIVGTDEDGISHSYPSTAIVTAATVSEQDYIVFEELTEEIVVGWVQTAFADQTSAIYQDIISGINYQKQTRVTSMPWE